MPEEDVNLAPWQKRAEKEFPGKDGGARRGAYLMGVEDVYKHTRLVEDARVRQLRTALLLIRARLHKPIRPYGDKKLPKIPEIDFLRDAYGEKLPNEILEMIDIAVDAEEEADQRATRRPLTGTLRDRVEVLLGQEISPENLYKLKGLLLENVARITGSEPGSPEFLRGLEKVIAERMGIEIDWETVEAAEAAVEDPAPRSHEVMDTTVVDRAPDISAWHSTVVVERRIAKGEGWAKVLVCPGRRDGSTWWLPGDAALDIRPGDRIFYENSWTFFEIVSGENVASRGTAFVRLRTRALPIDVVAAERSIREEFGIPEPEWCRVTDNRKWPCHYREGHEGPHAYTDGEEMQNLRDRLAEYEGTRVGVNLHHKVEVTYLHRFEYRWQDEGGNWSEPEIRYHNPTTSADVALHRHTSCKDFYTEFGREFEGVYGYSWTNDVLVKRTVITRTTEEKIT